MALAHRGIAQYALYNFTIYLLTYLLTPIYAEIGLD